MALIRVDGLNDCYATLLQFILVEHQLIHHSKTRLYSQKYVTNHLIENQHNVLFLEYGSL